MQYSMMICSGEKCDKSTSCVRHYKNGYCLEPSIEILSEQCYNYNYRYYKEIVKQRECTNPVILKMSGNKGKI